MFLCLRVLKAGRHLDIDVLHWTYYTRGHSLDPVLAGSDRVGILDLTGSSLAKELLRGVMAILFGDLTACLQV